MTDIERQIKLEADAVQEGVVRYFQSREYHVATDSGPGRDLVRNSLKPLADRILAEQSVLRYSQSGRPPKYGIPLLSISHEKLALIAIGTLLNEISKSEFNDGVGPRVTAVAYEIGQRCRIERIYDLFQARGVDIAAELLSRNRSRDSKRRAEELARKLDDEDDWTKSYRAYHLGEKLVALAVRFATFDGQPIFEMTADREIYGQQTKTTQRIALTAAAGGWMAVHENELAALASPVYLPMVVPPRPWTSLSEGGYLVTPLKLLTRQLAPQAQRLLETADLSRVFAAGNAIQNTGYRIHKPIYRIALAARDAGLPLFGQKKCADAADKDRRIKAIERMTAFRLSTAAKLLDEPHIYFPHQLDYRGRAYPVPQLINPQADDFGRAFLEFDEGKPLGEHGPNWLAIHLFNCYWKKEKVSFEKRLEWVHRNEREIIAFAENPLQPHRFWDEADNAWLLLAACHDWKGYRGQGPGYVSHLPISMDGSCNGYQHLSALGRDPIGGRATNLTPGEEPEDLYQRNADLVSGRIEIDAQSPGPNQEAARQLLGKIGRDEVKHATMTTPYGVTQSTIYAERLDSDLIKGCKDPRKCAKYMAKLLVDCIPEVTVAAGEIMKWMRKIARILAKKNRGMAWPAPSGFHITHASREPKAIRIATFDRTLVIYVEDEKQKISPRKQADGVVAHYVHSMDAAHMMGTTNCLHAAGIRHYAMVHDSFGVHAADVDLLHRVLREEFVCIYDVPVLQNFLDELRKANPDIALPDCPKTGGLDIRLVLLSPYFFA